MQSRRWADAYKVTQCRFESTTKYTIGLYSNKLPVVSVQLDSTSIRQVNCDTLLGGVCKSWLTLDNWRNGKLSAWNLWRYTHGDGDLWATRIRRRPLLRATLKKRIRIIRLPQLLYLLNARKKLGISYKCAKKVLVRNDVCSYKQLSLHATTPLKTIDININ